MFASGQACGPAEAVGREAGGVEAGYALPAETGSLNERPVNDCNEVGRQAGDFSAAENMSDLVADTVPTTYEDGTLPDSSHQLEDDYAASAHVNGSIDNLPDELTDAERIRAAVLIQSNAHLFSRYESDFGLTDLISHKINIGDHKPIKE